MSYIHGIFGLLIFCALAWLLSENRRAVGWRLPAAGIALQLVLAVVLLKLPPFQSAFLWLNSVVLALQEATEQGTSLVFGYIGGGPLPFEEPFPGAAWVFAFRALPLILVMSAVAALLFYWKILPVVIRGFSWALRRSLGVGGAVGVSASANIFVGMLEAPLFVRPYLKSLTRSELFMVMSCGLATVAGTVMVLYAAILSSVMDNVLGHILTASLISAPASILIARIMVPEDGNATKPTEADELVPPVEAATAMEALVLSTATGVRIIVNIIAVLIVIVALVHLANMIIGFVPGPGGAPLTIQAILSYIFAPLAWCMGLDWSEAIAGGRLLGTRMVLTEFVAYLDMAALPATALSDHARVILLYGLCGFASLPSLGIMIGGLNAMVPERRTEIIGLGFRSVIAATLATCMTGAVAGLVL